ncbi:hypothetical protein RSOLAG22IIIB_04618 [Rhizoctonia solani]|uniref:Uncharacterized protein n=1 Tax=Rhizoctonia solani TaxID=456999 RepID=A0A0K6FZ78_9AGAM|nr:unnamed protein product [Rhizoctonia solani]CUA71403.1 hypothetical protein RSOLAG22IIIB_04618 [Rhizoctonia solani]
MPSYAGFYVTPEDWFNWIHPRRPKLSHSVWCAESLIEQEIWRKRAGNFFAVTAVPSPECTPGNLVFGLIVYRRYSEEREYLKPRRDSKIDMNGPLVLERLIGLKASKWKTVWYDSETPGAPHKAEFLSPTIEANETYSGENSKKEMDSGENSQHQVQGVENRNVRFQDSIVV